MKHKNASFHLVLGLMGVILIVLVILISSKLPTQRRTLNNSSQFTQLWNLADIIIPPLHISQKSQAQPFMVLEGNELVLLGRNKRESNLSLLKLDLLTGQILWKVESDKQPSILLFDHPILFLETDYGHVASCDETQRPSCAGIKISTYNIQLEQQVWVNVFAGLPNISQIHLDDSGLIINGSGDHCTYEGVFIIDPQTGIEREAIFQEGCLGMSVSNREGFDPYDLPFGLSQGSDISFVDTISSNFAVGNSIVYVLTTDAELWAFDEETRQLQDVLTFTPGDLPLRSQNMSWVIAQDNLVVVYFRDTMQLFAYQFSAVQD